MINHPHTKIGSAYFIAIIIWAITPLATKWSTTDSFLFAAASRSFIAAIIALLICISFRIKLSLDKQALKVYLAGGLGTFGIVFFSLWGVQHIPSGWMALIYAAAPIITSILAAFFLKERHFGYQKTGGLIVSIIGISVIFNIGLDFSPDSAMGLFSILLSVFCYAGSSVAIKRLGKNMNAFAINTGSLIVAAFIFTIICFSSGYDIPDSLSYKTISGILYTAIVTSVIGNAVFYYILKNLDATRTTLLTLITPICALILGNLIDNEPLTFDILVGTTFVLSGILIFELRLSKRILSIIKNQIF